MTADEMRDLVATKRTELDVITTMRADAVALAKHSGVETREPTCLHCGLPLGYQSPLGWYIGPALCAICRRPFRN